jgi:methionyl-tRNA synthetase
VQWGGAKMSKTAGTAVNLDEAIGRHGPDALRYFLLREIGFENDGNFTWERFDARYVADLADTFGNLASRTLSMVQRYRAGVVPRDPTAFATPLERDAGEILAGFAHAMDTVALEDGAAQMIALAMRANRYVEETAPWKLAKEQRDAELDTVLANLARTVARLAVLALPFMPGKAAALWEALGSGRPLSDLPFAALESLDPAGWSVHKPPPLFPKDAGAA